MSFFEKIISCSEDEVDRLVEERIEQLNASKEPIEQLGFSQIRKSTKAYEGFIPLNTRIKYAT